MISTVAQSGFVSPANGTALNTTQSESLLALLSNYDAKNITLSDAKDIVSGIREIGIKSTRGLGDFFNQMGFNPNELAQKAGLRQNMGASGTFHDHALHKRAPHIQKSGPGFDLSSEENKPNDALLSLSRLVEKYEGSDLSVDDWANLYQDIEKEGFDVSRPLINMLI